MYKVIVNEEDNLFVERLNPKDKKLIKNKLLDLKEGNFHADKALKGRYKGKFRKRAGDFRIIYAKEEEVLMILVIHIGHRSKVYQ